MFTGIITHTAEIMDSNKNDAGLRITFSRPKDWDDLAIGESIATNGVCLTVASLDDTSYTCDVIPETLAVSSFSVSLPERVNLERALKLNDRLNGHLVQGHVDMATKVLAIDKNEGWRVSLGLDSDVRKYVAYKGSITINGVSLTVAAVDDTSFTVALIPYTLEHTTLGLLKVDDTVNIECDIIGKYVATLIEEKN